MASSGKLGVDVEIKSPAEKFWKAIKDSTNLFPKALPDQYKSIEVVEGDGNAVGSVRLFHYVDGIVKTSKLKIEFMDEEKRAVSYNIIEGDLLKYYKTFKTHVVIVPKEKGCGGCLMKWSCEYEKASDDVEDPYIITYFVTKNFPRIDDYIIAHDEY